MAVAEPSFEEALSSLEKIVEQLEEGNLSLEETLKKFEEGIKLSRLCDKKLKQAQKRVTMLTRDEQGDLKEVPFTEPDEPEKPENRDTDTKSLFDE
ncbi:MAG: exodeoxyribonuclease VII small subunit [Candidatus Abyssobacteria bacterium SURF_17]|uniref:Exodeoxyribonuclease 7 small subunit n=1 Tax=Candidatus Abyssobacteria bacterium SURF_17 TaxID=2093361 RepID=A0A419F505_9BACT|nr:MAG: exodeoxyribonuclease VII small subunit [Candidatus Abyssubacteria bacterium SURF_17]